MSQLRFLNLYFMRIIFLNKYSNILKANKFAIQKANPIYSFLTKYRKHKYLFFIVSGLYKKVYPLFKGFFLISIKFIIDIISSFVK